MNDSQKAAETVASLAQTDLQRLLATVLTELRQLGREPLDRRAQRHLRQAQKAAKAAETLTRPETTAAATEAEEPAQPDS